MFVSPFIFFLKVCHTSFGLPRRHSGKDSACQAGERKSDSWVGKIPQRRKRHPTAVFLPGESPGQRSLAGTVQGSQRVSATDGNRGLTCGATYEPRLSLQCWKR